MTKIKKTGLILLSCFLCFLLIEGFFSSAYVAYKLRPILRQPPGMQHAQYDPDLGWVSRSNYFHQDFYGPGVYVKTNSQGFRNEEDFSPSAPAGHIRIVCSGDSFTFGYGVDNRHTWCQLLESQDRRVQTVNMGQPGYGVDQMYLWYRRDGAALDHDVHLFAFISDDFRRMTTKHFYGTPKPFLQPTSNGLVAKNVPVPKPSLFLRWWTRRSRDIYDLRALRVMGSFAGKILPAPKAAAPEPAASDRLVVEKIFGELAALNKAKNSKLALVYLPNESDYSNSKTSLAWRQFIRKEAEKRDALFIDLIEEFRPLPIKELQKMFIRADSFEVEYVPAAKGHLTDAGNEYVAEKIYRALASTPEVAAKLEAASSPSP